MRNELEEIQRIEKYLSKELNPSELAAFEEEMKNNTSLQEKVNQQKILVKGIRKKAFKEMAKLTFKKYKLIKKMWWGGIGLCVAAVGISAVLILSNKEEEKDTQPIPTKAKPTIDTSTVDTVSLAPLAIPLTDSVITEKPKVKKKEVTKDTLIETKQSIKKTNNSLMLQEENINRVDIK